MENTEETNSQETSDQSSRKTVIGVRCFPELKNTLIKESSNRGLTLSEFCENILLNNNESIDDNKQLRGENERLRETIEKLQRLSDETKKETTVYINSLVAEKENLHKTLSEQKEAGSILSEPRLLELFAALKGKPNTIKVSGANAPAIFNSPYDLLVALIHSFQIKNH